ncbi:MAG: hypothetical protein FJ253_02360, partial [Phycisphaerae bacterium]|nr:hypothetical protein [Phycisphaerae bacterium]
MAEKARVANAPSRADAVRYRGCPSAGSRVQKGALMAVVGSMVIVGAGTMGSGIALTGAQAGISVLQIDVNPVQLEGAKAYHRKTLARAVEKGKLKQEEADAALGRITHGDSLAAARGAEWAVEAVSEQAELKKKIFRELAATLPSNAVLATNTS